MKDHQTYELIENYLAGRLSSDQTESFHLMLQSDADFSATFEQQKMMHEIIIDDGLLQEKARLRTFDFEKGEFKPSRKHPNYWSLGFLTIGLGIAIGTIVFWPTSDNPLPKKIAQNKRVSKINTKPKDTVKQQLTTDTQIEILPFPSKVVIENEQNKSHPVIHDKTSAPLKGFVKPDTLASFVETDESTLSKRLESQKKNETLPLLERKEKEPCSDIQIQGTIQTSRACYDELDGSISVTNPSGGQAPYKYALHDGQLKRKNHLFEKLAEGYYNVFVYDNNGCSRKWEDVFVEGQDCSKGKEHIFSLSRDSEWRYPISDDTSCEITIRNKVGQIIHTEFVESGFPNAWDGRNKQLNYVEPGNYPVTIQFPDDRVIVTAVTVLP